MSLFHSPLVVFSFLLFFSFSFVSSFSNSFSTLPERTSFINSPSSSTFSSLLPSPSSPPSSTVISRSLILLPPLISYSSRRENDGEIQQQDQQQQLPPQDIYNFDMNTLHDQSHQSSPIELPTTNTDQNRKYSLSLVRRVSRVVRKGVVSSLASLALLFSNGPRFNGQTMNGGNGKMNIATANAISLKPFSRRSLEEKLAPIPCYCIANPSGNLYLVSLSNGFDVGVIYTDYRDAEEALKEMNQANEQAPDARIMVLGMDKALQLVRQPPRRNGQQILLYQLCPSLQQLKNTNTFHQLGWKGLRSSTTSWKNGFNRKMLKKTGIPVFYSPSIVIRKGFESIRPIFFSMEDLNYAWERTAMKNNVGDEVETSPPDVRTFNLLKVFEWMLNEPHESAKFGFQADTGNQEYVQRILSMKNPHNKRPILNAKP